MLLYFVESILPIKSSINDSFKLFVLIIVKCVKFITLKLVKMKLWSFKLIKLTRKYVFLQSFKQLKSRVKKTLVKMRMQLYESSVLSNFQRIYNCVNVVWNIG